MSNFDAWTRELRAAGKGPVKLRAIDRGLPYSYEMAFGADLSADDFAASLRLEPDSGGSVLASFSVTVGAYSGGVTPVTLMLTQTQTAALPTDADFDGLQELVFDLLHTPDGGAQGRLLGGTVQVSGKVTNYGS